MDTIRLSRWSNKKGKTPEPKVAPVRDYWENRADENVRGKSGNSPLTALQYEFDVSNDRFHV